ncbi:MAG: AMP-binding protein, partial [Coriobacteriales bacterium]
MLTPSIDENLRTRYHEAGYWGDQTLLDVWEEQCARHASRCYVSDDRSHRLTYGQVDEQACKLGAWLQQQGVAEGDVVSFQLPVWAEFAVVYVACLKIGAVMHPVSCTFNTRDLVRVLNQVRAAAFFCPSVTPRCSYEMQALELPGKVASLKAICIMQCSIPSTSGFPTYEAVLDAPALELEPLRRTSSDDVALLLSTSGTTGTPKAVMLTHNNLLFSERAFTRELEVGEDDVMFMPAPLNHATGFNHGLLAPMITGGRVVLQQKFSAENAIDFMNAEGVTWSMGATPFIYDILNCITATGKRPRTLKFYLCGGAPVPGNMVHRARQEGIVLCEVYGSTESCPHIYVPRVYALGWNGKYSGRPFQGIEVRVVDEQGLDVAPGVQGEEISRGPHLFCGYLDNPRATEAAIDADGWFYSGDLCTMDVRGRIRINGRKKEI